MQLKYKCIFENIEVILWSSQPALARDGTQASMCWNMNPFRLERLTNTHDATKDETGSQITDDSSVLMRWRYCLPPCSVRSGRRQSKAFPTTKWCVKKLWKCSREMQRPRRQHKIKLRTASLYARTLLLAESRYYRPSRHSAAIELTSRSRPLPGGLTYTCRSLLLCCLSKAICHAPERKRQLFSNGDHAEGLTTATAVSLSNSRWRMESGRLNKATWTRQQA